MDDTVIARLHNLHEWVAPSCGFKIETIDAHAAGQPLRLILSGLPALRGRTIMERWHYVRQHFDHLLRAVIFEPRGHLDMYGCILTDPQRSDADFGALFVHRGGLSAMCGHGIIALTTILLEAGIVPCGGPETCLRIDTPAGPVKSWGFFDNDRVHRVVFENVPSFVVARDREVAVPGLGRTVKFDVAYGGVFFAFVDATAIDLACTPANTAGIQSAGEAILRAIAGSMTFDHPAEKDLSGLFGVVFTAPAESPADSRHVCVFAGGCIDRSPTGMALSARMTLLEAAGQLAAGATYTVEGILGGTFTGRLIDKVEAGGESARLVEVEGRAWITGKHTFFIDSDDPSREGFVL